MHRRVTALVSVLLLAVLMASAAGAADQMKVYVRNKPFKGKTMFREGRLYLPLQAFAAALELHAVQQGQSWCLSDKAHANAKCPDASAGLCVNGVALPNAIVQNGGETWVAAQPTVKALGGVYLENKSLGMIDIGLKYAAPPETAKAPGGESESVALGNKPVLVHWFANW